MEEISTTDGDLFCPSCNNEIGGYIWHGRGCECGHYMRPAIYLNANVVTVDLE